MSDSVNALPDHIAVRPDGPDSPGSVGWTQPLRVRLADETRPLPLECGESLYPVDVEYETYGTLSPARDNAILITHALSGDAHAAGWCANWQADDRPWRAKRPGWWDAMIGPGKPFDTSRYFVICSNVLGSCYGTTGPSSIDPRTGKPYGMRFPVVTVEDWVRLQERLVTHLGIDRLVTVCGGSLGGQQAIEWALAYPDRVRSVMVLAATPHLMAQGVAFNFAARNAVISDPNFRGGDYYGEPEGPDRGLAVARMIGHITYLSDTSMTSKFGRRLREKDVPGFQIEVEYEVESYLRHQGAAFVERFDGNSFLYITRAMDYFDAAEHGGGDLTRAMSKARCAWMIVSFSSDWLYPPSGSMAIATALAQNRRLVTYANLASQYGHDAFLLETERLSRLVTGFLANLNGGGE
ncbi:MAG: homoserine O-acetyltransferase [Deltaproteobacteria bacterium]|nr:homoserine O-acetyltransferase [Deltaproteobacteria bacterium]